MTFVVLDASVAMKWYVREDGSNEAQALLDSDVAFLVPDLFFVEVGSALVRQHREYRQLDKADVLSAARDVLNLDIEAAPSSLLLTEAVELSIALGHPIRDCFYLALAERLGLVLVTADQQLLRKVAASNLAEQVLPLGRIADIV
jgi:predicted nucleic acid-binding protein